MTAGSQPAEAETGAIVGVEDGGSGKAVVEASGTAAEAEDDETAAPVAVDWPTPEARSNSQSMKTGSSPVAAAVIS